MDSFIYNTIVRGMERFDALKVYINGTSFPYYFDTSVEFLIEHRPVIYMCAAAWLVVLFFTRQLQKIIINGLINRKLAALTKLRPRILNEGQKKHILIVGDSTAYGTGATQLEETLAGRFAHDFPNVETHNYAVNGSLTKDVLLQLKNVEGKDYNMVIISTGGNDTWHFSNIDTMAEDIRTVIEKSKQLSNGNVALIIYNNIASGPVFPFFIRGTLLRRTEKINKLFIQIAEELGIEPIPIFLEGERCPANFFAHDGLHPSSEGYRIMYVRLWSVLQRRMLDFNLRDF